MLDWSGLKGLKYCAENSALPCDCAAAELLNAPSVINKAAKTQLDALMRSPYPNTEVRDVNLWNVKLKT